MPPEEMNKAEFDATIATFVYAIVVGLISTKPKLLSLPNKSPFAIGRSARDHPSGPVPTPIAPARCFAR